MKKLFIFLAITVIGFACTPKEITWVAIGDSITYLNDNTEEYPYPLDAVGMTYDGLHPSDEGFTVIEDMLIRIMKNY